MISKPVFSIIIPHKNTPELLKRCLDSIPRRDDIQIIVVDDNSNEGIVDFAMMAGLKDKCVEVYLTKEGKGAGYVRNVGLKHAKGKWLLFADADDFFVEGAFEHLFACADSPEEIIYFKSVSLYSYTNEPANREQKYNKLADDYLEGGKYSEDRLRYLWNPPWAKMIKKELIDRHSLIFDEIPIANDLMFSSLAGHCALSVNAVDQVIYTTTVSCGSLQNVRNFELSKIKLQVFLRRNKFFKEVGKRHLCQSLITRFIQTTFDGEWRKKKKYKAKQYIGI